MSMSLGMLVILLVFVAFMWVMSTGKREEKIRDTNYLESLNYEKEQDCYIWKDRLQDYFYKDEIEDLSDFDRQAHCNFYLSTHRKIKGLISGGFDEMVEKEDVCFIEIAISADRPLMYVAFLKYPRGSGGTELQVSEKPFLSQHEEYLDSLDIFARAQGLVRLSFDELAQLTVKDGQACTMYFKYFDSFSERMKLPWL